MPLRDGTLGRGLTPWQERKAKMKADAQRLVEDRMAEEEVSKGLGARVLARGDIDRMMRTVQDAKERGELCLRVLGYGQDVIDEVALLLPEGSHGDEWFNCMLNRVGQRGVSYFNSDTDVVKCQPLPSEYDVRYDFFTTDLGVRLELLRLRGGYSPLHDLYRRNGRASSNNAEVVHVSFKVADVPSLEAVYRDLSEKGWMLGQDCTSRYGRFGYWRHPDHDGPLLWLKPRTNLRDVPKPVGGEHGDNELVVAINPEGWEAEDDEEEYDDEDE